MFVVWVRREGQGRSLFGIKESKLSFKSELFRSFIMVSTLDVSIWAQCPFVASLSFLLGTLSTLKTGETHDMKLADSSSQAGLAKPESCTIAPESKHFIT